MIDNCTTNKGLLLLTSCDYADLKMKRTMNYNIRSHLTHVMPRPSSDNSPNSIADQTIAHSRHLTPV